MTNPDTSARRTLRLLLIEGRACQFQRSKGPKRPDYDQETGKPIGSAHSDPTADAALDPRRLRLRDAVKHGERALLFAGPDAWREATASLELALDAWAGH